MSDYAIEIRNAYVVIAVILVPIFAGMAQQSWRSKVVFGFAAFGWPLVGVGLVVLWLYALGERVGEWINHG